MIVAATRIAIFICMPFLLLHETCHYLAARLMGANAELHWHYVSVRGLQSNWQRIMFKLAPSFMGIGVSLGIAVFILYFQFHVVLLIALTVWFCLAWQIACYVDFYDVCFFLKHQHWHPNENKIYSLEDSFTFKWNPRD